MDGNANSNIIDAYPCSVSWGDSDIYGRYHDYAVHYATAYAKPHFYIDGIRVGHAEFAAVYGYFLPAIAYPPTNANQRP